MIFVAIKLIVVYGIEIQECKRKWRKGRRLMDKANKGLLRGVNGSSSRGLADFRQTAVETVG